VSIPKLIKYAMDNNFDGFVLMTSKMPSQNWFDTLNKELISSTIDIFVVVEDEKENKAFIRSGGIAKDLLQYPNGVSEMEVLHYVDEDGNRRELLQQILKTPTLLYY